MNDNNQSRRKFLYNLSLAGLSIPLISSNSKCNDDKTSNQQSMNDPNKKAGKLGIALVGLGNYSNGQLGPALQQTSDCYLAGIVTGTPSKIDIWKKKYSIPDKNVYNYENFDSIKDNPDIDVIYIVLPNSMHTEYTIRAAKASKHVICEKPMALTAEDCDKMIETCKNAGKMLSIGYRLHFEPYNLEMARLGQKEIYGKVKTVSGGFGFTLGDPNQWRVKKALSGGGPLQDLGIYCVQGICYTTGMNPIAVTAQEGVKTDKEKFKEVEQSLTWQLEMPNGIICEGKASYGNSMNYLRAEAEKGIFELTSAFNYSGQRGNTIAGAMDFPRVNQQALQINDFALAIKNNRPTLVPGEMGKRDVKIIQAIYEAMRTGKRVLIK